MLVILFLWPNQIFVSTGPCENDARMDVGGLCSVVGGVVWWVEKCVCMWVCVCICKNMEQTIISVQVKLRLSEVSQSINQSLIMLFNSPLAKLTLFVQYEPKEKEV